MLFAAERLVSAKPQAVAPESEVSGPPRAPELEPRSLVVSDEAKRLLVEEHTRSYGKPPTSEELAGLVDRWIDQEILYREGLARSLDQDDPRIRHLVAQKMAFILEQSLVLPPPTDRELEAWFSAHADKWAKPALVDFTHVFVQGDDTRADARARALLAELERGADPGGLGDMFSGGRRYRRRSVAQLAESFGREFVGGLDEQEAGAWALRRSRFGVHLVRVDRRTPADDPALADVRAEVEDDYARAKRDEGLAEAVSVLRQRWTIEGGP